MIDLRFVERVEYISDDRATKVKILQWRRWTGELFRDESKNTPDTPWTDWVDVRTEQEMSRDAER